MEIVLLAAVAENGVIGSGNAIPWRLKSDQQRLKAMTLNKPIVMGRKTFESLRRPLPGRTNIVVTRDPNYRARGAIVTTSLENARAIALGDALRRFATEIAIIGGAEIYAQALPLASTAVVTEIEAAYEGDAYAPQFGPEWIEAARERHVSSTGLSFSFVTYCKNTGV